MPNYGIGRVVLTQKCLYFLEQPSNKRKLLTEIKDIKQIEKSLYKKGVFQSKPALKITNKECKFISLKYLKLIELKNEFLFVLANESIYLCFGSDINVWYILINELYSAVFLSGELFDPSIIQYAARNLTLLDSVLHRWIINHYF